MESFPKQIEEENIATTATTTTTTTTVINTIKSRRLLCSVRWFKKVLLIESNLSTQGAVGIQMAAKKNVLPSSGFEALLEKVFNLPIG